MRPVTYSQTATGISSPVPLDHKTDPFNVTITVDISGGTATCKVQFSVDDPASYSSASTYNSSATWFDHATLTALTANAVGNIAFPVRAVRTNISALSGATVKTTVIQAGRFG